MEARAWRLAGGSAVALLVLVALVSWRADSLAGGWLLALRVTGLLAVVGLLGAVVLGSLAALRPPTAPSVVVSVPTSGAPRATAQPGRAALVPLKAVLLLAVVSAAPVLSVLVLATAPDDVVGAAGDPAPRETEPGSTASSSATTPTTPPSDQPGDQPSGSPPSAGDQPGQAAPAPSPAQLPSDAAAQAVCEQVVVSGDSLWTIAAGQLGEGASDADVDARWRALYDRNATAVGADPDLVRPGLVLRTCS